MEDTKRDEATIALVSELCDTLKKKVSLAIQRQKEAWEDIQTKLGYAMSRLNSPSQGTGAQSHVSIDSALNAEYHRWEKVILTEFLEELTELDFFFLVRELERKKAAVSRLADRLREVTQDRSADVKVSLCRMENKGFTPLVGLSEFMDLRRDFFQLDLTKEFVSDLQKIVDKVKDL